MKFEPDLVREILRICVEAPGFPPSTPKIDGYTADQVGHHIWLMGRSGLVIATGSDGDSSTIQTAMLLGLDGAGQAMWAKIEDETLWRRAIKAAGSFSLEALKAAILSQL